MVLTVDLNSDSNRIALARDIRRDERDCSACHDPSREDSWLDRKPMYRDTGATTPEFLTPGMTWDYIGRLKSITDMKVVIKGVVTAEDAESALRNGADAVCIGRAYLWGLAAFGQPGVEKVLDLLSAELSMVMSQVGAPSLKDIGPQHIGRH